MMYCARRDADGTGKSRQRQATLTREDPQALGERLPRSTDRFEAPYDTDRRCTCSVGRLDAAAHPRKMLDGCNEVAQLARLRICEHWHRLGQAAVRDEVGSKLDKGVGEQSLAEERQRARYRNTHAGP